MQRSNEPREGDQPHEKKLVKITTRYHVPTTQKAGRDRQTIPNVGNNGGDIRNSPDIISWWNSLAVSYKVKHILWPRSFVLSYLLNSSLVSFIEKTLLSTWKLCCKSSDPRCMFLSEYRTFLQMGGASRVLTERCGEGSGPEDPDRGRRCCRL